MKDKYLQTLFTLLLLLVGIWFGQQWWEKRQERENSALVLLDPGVNAQAVDIIEIVLSHEDAEDEIEEESVSDDTEDVDNEENELIRLVARDSVWYIDSEDQASGNAQAKGEDVQQLLSVLNGIDVRLVSTNVNRHQSLGVSDDGSHRVLFKSGEEIVYTLLVSADNSDLVRQAGRANVYEWDSQLGMLVTQNEEAWVAPSPTPDESTESADVSE